jgi:hypothetical protein
MPLVLLLLALGSAMATLLGPLVLGWIQWRVGPNLINQTYGADAAQLVLVTPTALLTAWLWRKRQRVAQPLGLGVGLATLYYAIASVLGADYTYYAGNNERFFLLYLLLIVLAWIVAARSWAALDPEPPLPGRWLARGFGAFLVAASLVISAAWLAQLMDIALTGGLTSTAAALEYAEGPSAFWTVRIVDLGFIVPIAVATGAGLWRSSPFAVKAAYGLAAFMTLQAFAVLAMGTVMVLRNDPTASPVLVAVLAPISFAGAALTVELLRSYATPRPRVGPDAGGSLHAALDAVSH